MPASSTARRITVVPSNRLVISAQRSPTVVVAACSKETGKSYISKIAYVDKNKKKKAFFAAKAPRPTTRKRGYGIATNEMVP